MFKASSFLTRLLIMYNFDLYVVFIVTYQVQKKREGDSEIWEPSKSKKQKFVLTKNSSTYNLPKNINCSALIALENTKDEIDEEIRIGKALFEEDRQKTSVRPQENPSEVRSYQINKIMKQLICFIQI